MFHCSGAALKLYQSLIFKTGKLTVTELFFEVPKDYSNPDRGTIQLFARSVSRYEKPTTIISEEERRKKSMVSTSNVTEKSPYSCKSPETLVCLPSRRTRLSMFSSTELAYHKHRPRERVSDALPRSERNWLKHSYFSSHTCSTRRSSPTSRLPKALPCR